MTPEITPTDATLGATVRNVRLDAIDDETFAAVEAAWHAYAVLMFPDQHLTEEAQVAFSERFGPLERSLTKTHTQGDPAIIHLSNVKKDGTLWGADSDTGRLLHGNNFWHTDSSFKRIPAKGSALSAKIVPKTGGETAFADMRAAFDALEPAMRDWLADKTAVHSYAYSQSKVGGMGGITEDEWDSLPPVEQPVIRTHPATGRRNLYIGRHASHIVGEDQEESRRLLERLCADACRPPRIFVHKWREGDLVLWDNRCVLHRGLGHPPDQPRRMVRTTIAGDAGDANEWVA
ncbi:MAG: TauD/TfdA family dioxygenase [Rhodospirillales bacterium]|nr:TauD/TfdA family dioxygenase [Rhodospirillales bacterium]